MKITIEQLALKCCEDQNINYVLIFKKWNLLDRQEKKLLTWIQDFYNKYSAIPDVSRLKSEFTYIGFIDVPTNPLVECVELCRRYILNRDIVEFFNSSSTEIEECKVDLLDRMLRLEDIAISSNTITHDTIVDDYFNSSNLFRFYEPYLDNNISVTSDSVIWFAGRPASFKTTLCQWLAMRQYINSKNVLVIANETGLVSYASRIDSFLFNIPFESFLTGKFTEFQEQCLKVGKSKLSSVTNGSITYRKGFLSNVPQIKSMVDNMNDKPDAIFIDGIYLAGDKDNWTSFSKISSDVKQLSLDCSVPILGPIHLNRNNTSMPVPENVALSDSFLKDCDAMFGLWKPELDADYAVLNQLKSRHDVGIPLSKFDIDRESQLITFGSLGEYKKILEDF